MKAKILRLLALGLIAGSQATNAAVVLDQDNFVSADFGATGFTASWDTTFGRSQTFTVGVSGILDRVEIALCPLCRITDWGPLQILQTSGGNPIGGSAGSTILATSTSLSSVDNIYSFNLRGAGLMVNVGDVLAIQPVTTTENASYIYWQRSQSYAGGSDFYFNTAAPTPVTAWTATDWDSMFRTYVDDLRAVPEPGTLALLGLGLAGLAATRRRKQ